MFRRTLIVSALFATLPLAALAQDKPLKVGVTAGPHAQILEQVKKVAEKDGLKIQIVEFSDYVQPNAALAAGDLDINSYQHKPYLDQQVKDRGYKLAPVGYTVNFPIGIYSKKVKKLDELKEGARAGIPNDPTNGGRVLLVLQDQGLIKLRPEAGLKATPLDVTANPKKLRFVELDAAQLPRSLDDLDASAINTNYALTAGLHPG
jgi:D-methionine transport system substrate-binding protein